MSRWESLSPNLSRNLVTVWGKMLDSKASHTHSDPCSVDQCLKLSQKSCRSSCLKSQIKNIKLKKNQQKVPGPPPKLSASDRRTFGNFHYCRGSSWSGHLCCQSFMFWSFMYQKWEVPRTELLSSLIVGPLLTWVGGIGCCLPNKNTGVCLAYHIWLKYVHKYWLAYDNFKLIMWCWCRSALRIRDLSFIEAEWHIYATIN